MQEQMTAAEKMEARKTGIAIEKDRIAIAEAERKPLYLRMTPEILAELAFQQVNLLASRLSVSQQVDYYERLQKYIDLSHISSIENSDR